MLKKNSHYFLALALLCGVNAHAQTAQNTKPRKPAADAAATPAKTNGAKTKKVQVTFSDELVDGSTVKPDVDSINAKKDFNYKKLIRVRENFVNEMEDGLNDFKGH